MAAEAGVAERLRFESWGRKASYSQVVTDLIRAMPKRFTLVDRGVKGLSGTEGQAVQGPPGATGPLGVVSEAG